MCPLYPFHLVLLYLCLLLPLLFAIVEGSEELFANWKVTFLPNKVDKLMQFNSTEVRLRCEDCPVPQGYDDLKLNLAAYSHYPAVGSLDSSLAEARHEYEIGGGLFGGGGGAPEVTSEIVIDVKGLGGSANWSVPFNVTGNFLGFATVKGRFVRAGDKEQEVVAEAEDLQVSVQRKKTPQSKVRNREMHFLFTN